MIEPVIAQEENMTLIILRRFFKHKLAGIAVAVLLLLIVASALASLNPYSPTDQNPTNKFQDPGGGRFGPYDELGRDVFSRILHGVRLLAVGLLSTCFDLRWHSRGSFKRRSAAGTDSPLCASPMPS